MTKEIEEKVIERAGQWFISGNMSVKDFALSVAKSVYDLLTPSGDVQERAKEIERELKGFDAYFNHFCQIEPKHERDKDSGHTWISFSDKWGSFKRLLAGASSVGGMQWVRASDRMPKDIGDVFVRWIDTGKMEILHTRGEHFQVLIDFNGYHYKKDQIYWLDESSPSSMQGEVEALKAWKESAMKAMNDIDLQECGKVLGVPLGQDIASNILPGIKALQAENERLRALFKEFVVRTQRCLPVTEEQLKWFEEETDCKLPHVKAFMRNVFETLGLTGTEPEENTSVRFPHGK